MKEGSVIILTKDDISGDIDIRNWVFQIKNDFISDCKKADIVYYFDDNKFYILKDKYNIYNRIKS